MRCQRAARQSEMSVERARHAIRSDCPPPPFPRRTPFGRCISWLSLASGGFSDTQPSIAIGDQRRGVFVSVAAAPFSSRLIVVHAHTRFAPRPVTCVYNGRLWLTVPCRVVPCRLRVCCWRASVIGHWSRCASAMHCGAMSSVACNYH